MQVTAEMVAVIFHSTRGDLLSSARQDARHESPRHPCRETLQAYASGNPACQRLAQLIEMLAQNKGSFRRRAARSLLAA